MVTPLKLTALCWAINIYCKKILIDNNIEHSSSIIQTYTTVTKKNIRSRHLSMGITMRVDHLVPSMISDSIELFPSHSKHKQCDAGANFLFQTQKMWYQCRLSFSPEISITSTKTQFIFNFQQPCVSARNFYGHMNSHELYNDNAIFFRKYFISFPYFCWFLNSPDEYCIFVKCCYMSRNSHQIAMVRPVQ